ncbi:C-N hydrolase family amidase [Raoultella planticola]|uniref:C-N hydrolase family amidase n=1 Tax=Raoultella planticola TaxID=575 RepID=A0A485B5D1_RAOPL|nr:C-N hydrolase family amidase [Raoultella planticola]
MAQPTSTTNAICSAWPKNITIMRRATNGSCLEWRGWRILPLVCYDLRFPVWSRNHNDYDLALYVANWPAPRSLHWQSLLVARAIENLAYCCRL